MARYDGFACPLDGLALTQQGNSVLCAQGHCFDLDKRGAVNLLPVQFKKSKHPGDSKEMIAARGRVLDSGAYAPIRDALSMLLRAQQSVLFDAGCGEGYYTAQLMRDGVGRRVIGMDISKDAIHAAAKRCKDTVWCVGTNAHIPMMNASVDVVVCLFGFPVYDEFARIIRAGGVLVMGDPGPEHLIELRRALYDEVTEKERDDSVPTGFEAVTTHSMRDTAMIADHDVMRDLIMMTPHGFRSAPERIDAAVAALAGKALTLDVTFRVYRKVNHA